MQNKDEKLSNKHTKFKKIPYNINACKINEDNVFLTYCKYIMLTFK